MNNELPNNELPIVQRLKEILPSANVIEAIELRLDPLTFRPDLLMRIDNKQVVVNYEKLHYLRATNNLAEAVVYIETLLKDA